MRKSIRKLEETVVCPLGVGLMAASLLMVVIGVIVLLSPSRAWWPTVLLVLQLALVYPLGDWLVKRAAHARDQQEQDEFVELTPSTNKTRAAIAKKTSVRADKKVTDATKSDTLTKSDSPSTADTAKVKPQRLTVAPRYVRPKQ